MTPGKIHYDVKVKSQEKALSLYRCQRGLSESVSKVFVHIDETDYL